VFLRPMNPALSAQNYFLEDSPVFAGEHESWYKRAGIMLTPASPLYGSVSYMSQESSCCSALNNAVIMDEDDNETIPTDERPSLVPVDDVSPIVEKSLNQSDFAPNRASPVDSRTVTNISSEDRNNSSLQEFLCTQPPVVDMAFIGNSPGPQWSPGIRDSFKSPNPHSVIRIESTLHYLDGMPSSSPKKPNSLADINLSLSAILPVTQGTPSVIETRIENSSSLVSSIHQTPGEPIQEANPQESVENSIELEESDGHISQVLDMPPTVQTRPSETIRELVVEPSPVRKLTHARSVKCLLEPRSCLPSISRPIVEEDRNSSFINRSICSQRSSSGRRSESPYLYSNSKILSSEERELREAQDGRRKLLEQIRLNRRTLENMKASVPDEPPSMRSRLNISFNGRNREESFSRITSQIPSRIHSPDSFVFRPPLNRLSRPQFSIPAESSVNTSRLSSRARTPSSDRPPVTSSRKGPVRIDIVTPQAYIASGPPTRQRAPISSSSSIYGNHRRLQPVSFASSLRTSSSARPAWR
jgi:hypothetical protein